MEENRILAQSVPLAAIETDLYQVQQDATARILGFTVTNRGAAGASFRFAFALRGAATANDDYVYYDLPIIAHDTFMVTFEVTLQARDAVRIYASNANLSFTLYGIAT